MNNTRRSALKITGALGTLVTLGLITEKQALAQAGRPGFEAKNLADALKAVGGTPANSDQINLQAPDIAENGAVVPVGVTSNLANTTQIMVLVEKNPFPLAAIFTVPEGTDPSIQTRVKMGQSSNVVAVVKAGGKLYSVTKETKVTLGGCGG